jgi:hypothetical protein
MKTYAVTDPQKYFFLHGGGELKSLEELFVELQTMDHGVFSHHVTPERHDFATWVKDVMGDRMLAKNMTYARTKEEMEKLLFVNMFR